MIHANLEEKQVRRRNTLLFPLGKIDRIWKNISHM